MNLSFVFSQQDVVNLDVGDEDVVDDGELIDDVNEGDLDIMFDGLGNGESVEIHPKLTMLRERAKEIAQETYTEADGSMEQLEKNLRSLIGQKAVEFNLLASLIIRTSAQLRDYYSTVFGENQGKIELDECDITEAYHAVLRSRKIFQAFLEAEDFQQNFLRQKCKMPKSYFLKKNLALPSKRLAMIFSLHYIRGKKAEVKSVKQSLAKNATFKAFAIKMPEVIADLTDLGVLTTERRMVRRKRGRDAVEIERLVPFFLVIYNGENQEHVSFLQQYQAIYPGEVFP